VVIEASTTSASKFAIVTSIILTLALKISVLPFNGLAPRLP
jgi:hypothetical protein